jgi:hypothetical protein
MTLLELKNLWIERKARFERKLSDTKARRMEPGGVDYSDVINLEAKIAELTECLHELGHLET